METPLVTVICLCYNHERFVVEALQSVFTQTYSYIQLIVVDDASTDSSVMIIRELLKNQPDIPFLSLKENNGNCKAFNKGLSLSKGDFIIDLAADDVMLPDRIEKQVSFFQSLHKKVGIVFTDSVYIDENGRFMRNHFEYLFQKNMIDRIPQGNVFPDVLRRYFISSPTMMIRKEVMQSLHGYDEELAYEDFDLWIRASREYEFAFFNERLTKVRKSSQSMSRGWYKKGDKQLLSTYKVCLKAKELVRNEVEKDALISRLQYELRQSLFSENFIEAKLFFGLLKKVKKPSFLENVIYFLIKVHLPLSGLRTLYHRLYYS